MMVSAVENVLAAYEAHWPELRRRQADGTRGWTSRDLAARMVRLIPASGIASEATADEVAEYAAEAVAAWLKSEPTRPSPEVIVRYLVTTFRRVVTGEREMLERDTLSFLALRRAEEERHRLELQTLREREEAARRPPPNPDLPRAALARFPRPPEFWTPASAVIGAELGDLPTGPSPVALGSVFKRDELEEERELAHANEAWRGQ